MSLKNNLQKTIENTISEKWLGALVKKKHPSRFCNNGIW